jgi:hypothetical protein
LLLMLIWTKLHHSLLKHSHLDVKMTMKGKLCLFGEWWWWWWCLTWFKN